MVKGAELGLEAAFHDAHSSEPSLTPADDEAQAFASATPAVDVLVVDDDDHLRELFTFALRREGLSVDHARDGRQALTLLGQRSYSAMVLDVCMPGMSGIDVLEQLRNSESNATLPVLLITAGAADVDAVSALECGADDYISKTVPLVELVARVRSQLRRVSDSRRIAEGQALDHQRLFGLLAELHMTDSVERHLERLCAEVAALAPVSSVAVVNRTGERGLVLAAQGDAPYGVGEVVALSPSQGTPRTWPSGDDLTTSAPIAIAGRHIGTVVLSVAAVGSDVGRRARALAQDAATVAAVLLGRSVVTGDDRDALEHLNQLIATRAFRTAFQPVVSLATGEVVGYEALTRFDDGHPPDVRFATAKRLGVAFGLERATMATAVTTSVHLPPGPWLALNCSAAFVAASEGLAAIIASTEREVVLEITESDPIEDYEYFQARFDRLGPGVKLAVDDAGAGHASLRHVASLDPPIVKLDRSLVHRLHENPTRLALLAGMVHFARSTDRILIAEGVEQEEEAEALRSLGVGLGQGYLFGRPTTLTPVA